MSEEASTPTNYDELIQQAEAHFVDLNRQEQETAQNAAAIAAAKQQLLGRVRLLQELKGEVPPLDPVAQPDTPQG